MIKQKLNTKYLISLGVSILLAFLVGAVILLCTGHSPLKAYGAMLSGAFSAPRHLGDVLEYAMVLALCGLACDLGSRVGIFNVGGEGQLLLGAIVAAPGGVALDGTTAWLVIPLAALAAIVTAALYALIPGVLKVKLKVNEVITTIMLNTVAASLCQYLAKGPWKNSNKTMISATERLNANYWFGGLIRGSKLSTAILAAAIIAFFVWYVMQKTTPGFEMKLTGQNPRFARFSGMRIDRKIIVCMALSGAICGLVGMFRVYGAERLFKPSVSNDYYFEGLMVAMIARYQPLATILLSLFFAVLKIGAEGLQQVGVPNQIYLIIQTVIIFFMAAQSGFLEAAAQNPKLRGLREKLGKLLPGRKKGGEEA
jgi:ABC-type uncharacterized transport system, permease component